MKHATDFANLVRAVWRDLRHSRDRDAAAYAMRDTIESAVDGTVDRMAYMGAVGVAVAMRARPVCHTLRNSVARLVDETDLHALPDRAPTLLRDAWMIEVRSPNERLFDETTCIAGYPIGHDGDTEMQILGRGIDTGDAAPKFWSAKWRPDWNGATLDATLRLDLALHEGNASMLYDWTREAARFVTILALLLEADGAPIDVVTEKAKGRARNFGGNGNPTDEWTIRRIVLGHRTNGTEGRPSSGESPAAPPAGLIVDEVRVRGHLKRQRHGENNAEIKWIYVASYEARRWLSPRPLRIVVDLPREAR